MNWRTTGTVLLVFGALLAVGGFIWRNSLHDEAHTCRIRNLARTFADDCPTTTPGLVTGLVGVGVAVLAVALIAGTSGRSGGTGQAQP